MLTLGEGWQKSYSLCIKSIMKAVLWIIRNIGKISSFILWSQKSIFKDSKISILLYETIVDNFDLKSAYLDNDCVNNKCDLDMLNIS